MGGVEGQLVILDGFGRPFRYRSALDKEGNPVPYIRTDRDHDLWSVGPDGLPTDLSVPGTTWNENAYDDIWE